MPRFTLATYFNNPALPVRATPGFKDKFERADNALTLGNTEDGKTWEYVTANGMGVPTFGISNGMARLISITGVQAEGMALVDANTYVGSLTATIGAIGEAGSGLLVCASDGANHVRVGFRSVTGNTTLNISSRVENVSNAVITAPGVNCATGDVIEVRVSRSTVDVYKNGVLALAKYPIPEGLIGNTKHGIWGHLNSPAVRWGQIEFKGV